MAKKSIREKLKDLTEDQRTELLEALKGDDGPDPDMLDMVTKLTAKIENLESLITSKTGDPKEKKKTWLDDIFSSD